jgi:ATP-dependent RNA helicase RhlE
MSSEPLSSTSHAHHTPPTPQQHTPPTTTHANGHTTAAHPATPAAGITFASLHLAKPVLAALTDQGYHTPTPIQAKAIGPALAGRDVLGCAQTGTGKTAAFALPILSRLLTTPSDALVNGRHLPRVLVLSPTRELASQIGDSFATYGRHTTLRHTVVFGGVGQAQQVRALRAGVDILVATPGRLEDLKQQGHINLTNVQIFVLDEADRMLDMGFIVPIKRISAALAPTRQTMLFSATMPREIQHLADALLKQPVKVAVTPVASAAPKIEQRLYFLPKKSKPALLMHLLADPAAKRCVVFTKTKHGADRVTEKLVRNGVPAVAIHGNKAQNQRARALDAFATGRFRVLVATDVAARGLDIDAVTHVFNFDLPMEAEAYIHRIGRTGRAGNTGIAIAFCDADERDLLRSIERLTGKRLTPTPLPDNLPKLEPTEREAEDRQQYAGYQGKAPHHSSGHSPGHSHDRPNNRYAGGSYGSPSRDGPRQGHGARPNTTNPATPTHTERQTRQSMGLPPSEHPRPRTPQRDFNAPRTPNNDGYRGGNRTRGGRPSGGPGGGSNGGRPGGRPGGKRRY